MTVTLGLTPDGGRPESVVEHLDAATAAGFRSVGLAGRDATFDVGALLAARGLRCHEVLSLRVSGRDGVVDQAQRLARAASTVGAPWILTGGFRGALTGDRLRELALAADVVAEADAGLALEFTPFGTLRSLGDAAALVSAIGHDNIGVMIDSWHFCRGDSTWDELATVPLEQVAYVQFADAQSPASDDAGDETMNRRALPGDGVLELDRFATTLLERSWQGVVSVEALGRDLRQLPLDEFARRAHEAAARYWA